MGTIRFATLTAVLALGAAAPASASALVGHRVETSWCSARPRRRPRSVKVHLWYPAEPARFATPRRPCTAPALYGQTLTPSSGPIGWKVEAEVARESDAIDPYGKPLPVIVFSHGSVKRSRSTTRRRWS